MPLFESRDSKDARARVSEAAPDLARRLLDAGNRVQDLQFRIDRVVKAELAEGDVDQLQTGIRQAQGNLDACRRALPLLQRFGAAGQLDGGEFHSLKPLFLEEDEDPEAVQFDRPWDAALWLADRVREFADYLEGTQLPWLERSVQEVQTGGDSAVDQVRQADEARQQATSALDDFSRRFPDLHVSHAVNLQQDLSGAWSRLQERQREQVHNEIVAAAQDVLELSEGLQNTVSEAAGFRQDATAKVSEGHDFLDGLRDAYRRAGMGPPVEAADAQASLDAAGLEARKPTPDWNEAVRLYIRASNLAAEAADRLPEER